MAKQADQRNHHDTSTQAVDSSTVTVTEVQTLWDEINSLFSLSLTTDTEPSELPEGEKRALSSLQRFIESQVNSLIGNTAKLEEIGFFVARPYHLEQFSTEFESLSFIVDIDNPSSQTPSTSQGTLHQMDPNSLVGHSKLKADLSSSLPFNREKDNRSGPSTATLITLFADPASVEISADVLRKNFENLTVGEAIEKLNQSFWLVNNNGNHPRLIDPTGQEEQVLMRDCLRYFLMRNTDLRFDAYRASLDTPQQEQRTEIAANSQISPLELFRDRDFIPLRECLDRLNRIYKSYSDALSLLETGSTVGYQQKLPKSPRYQQSKDFYSVVISSAAPDSQETSPSGKNLVRGPKVVTRHKDGTTTILVALTQKADFMAKDITRRGIPTGIDSYDNPGDGYFIDGNTPILDPALAKHLDTLWESAEDPDFRFTAKTPDPHQARISAGGEGASGTGRASRPWTQTAIEKEFNLPEERIKRSQLRPDKGMVTVNIFPNHLIVEPDLAKSAAFVVTNNEAGWKIIRTKNGDYIHAEYLKEGSDETKDRAVCAWIKHPSDEHENRETFHLDRLRAWAN